MNDLTSPQDPADEPSQYGTVPSSEEVPQFGAVDIVEAFTAMRHEWRGQTKESRALAERLQAAAANIQALESKLLAVVADRGPDAEARPLALLIAETDHQLTRAVTAAEQWEAERRRREEADAKAVEACVAAMSGAARWLAHPLLTLLAAQRSAHAADEGHPTLEGLNMVLARLRRMMREQGIERLDVQGEPFDADTMHAIGAVAATDFPPGHVAEQLSPAYLRHGEILRFADVRVAS
jgi:molecular chaperone GrpE